VIGRVLAFTGPVPLVGVYLAGLRWDAPAYILFPLAIAAGLYLVLYRVRLGRLSGGRTMPGEAVLRGFVGLAAGACLFWSASNYAEVLGEDLARDFAATLPYQVQVVIHSSVPLHLDAPGVRGTVQGTAQEPYRYRYSGLRLMDRRGGRYFLVPENWTLDGGVVMVVRDDDTLRVDFVKGGTNP
jgi:hypothetical protein